MKSRNFYVLLLILTIFFITFSYIDTVFKPSSIELTSILIVISYVIIFASIANNLVKEYKIKRRNSRFISQHLDFPTSLQILPYTDTIIPKDIIPYEFYCSSCKETSFGYTVFCPRCGRRMKQPQLDKKEKNNKVTCVICYKDNCPICERKIEGENSCYEECPYCERTYHQHCWEKTIKTFGKCGFCLEIPPSEMIRQIFKNTPLDSKSTKKRRRYILSKPINLSRVPPNPNASNHQESEEAPESKTEHP